MSASSLTYQLVFNSFLGRGGQGLITPLSGMGHWDVVSCCTNKYSIPALLAPTQLFTRDSRTSQSRLSLSVFIYKQQIALFVHWCNLETLIFVILYLNVSHLSICSSYLYLLV